MSVTDEVANPEPEGESDPLERVVSREKIEVEKLMPAGIFGYSAGKSIIAHKLIGLFPAHKSYVEPFCGSAAMFFTKEAAPHEVLNDRDEDVMHAYKILRNASPADFDKLAKKDWTGTPATHAKVKASSPTDPIDRAYKYLYLNHFTYGKGKNGSFRPDADGRICKVVERAKTFQPRLKGAKLMCGHYEKAIKDHDSKEAFHFLDPPYAGTNSWGGGVGEKEFNETDFRKVLEGIKGKFLVTYGTTGKLDTSGFDVKRMRQSRTVGRIAGGGKKNLTHLLVSNFKVAAKSMGDGVELDDVVSIIDADGQGSRIMATGSRTSVSVPEQLAATREWKNANDLLEYPAETGPVPATLRLRFLEKRFDLDMVFHVNYSVVAWTLDVQRAEVPVSPELVAKSFSVEGSRAFLPLTKGVGAAETPLQSLATAVVTLEAPHVEFGLQTETSHEYFLSKSGEAAGQLVLGRGGEGASTLFDAHPWLATFIDTKFIPNAVLKGAPMPPDGVSALPVSIEKVIPPEFRYWELRGVEAHKSRDALIASGFFDRVNAAVVDGQIEPVTSAFKVFEPETTAPPVDTWPLYKAASLLREGDSLVEVFTPGPSTLAKASQFGRVIYVDAGAVGDGALEALTKSLCAQAGDYVITAVDSPGARELLKSLGRPFQFRPGDGVAVDAVKRVFVASFGVRGEDILWLDKNDNLEGAPSQGDVLDPRKGKPSLREYTTPSDDTVDLGKSVTEFLRKAVVTGLAHYFNRDLASIEKSMVVGAEHRDVLKDVFSAVFPGHEMSHVIRSFVPSAEGADVQKLSAHHDQEGDPAGVDAAARAAFGHDLGMAKALASARAELRRVPDARVVVKHLAAFDAGHLFAKAETSGGVNLLMGQLAAVVAKHGGPKLVSPSSSDLLAAVLAVLHKNEWSTSYINNLQDTSFLYIEPGGTRDEEGKTKPRALRHFPYRDKSGAVDEAHLRNAIAQAPKASLARDVIDRVQDKGRKLLATAKAEFNNPDPGGAGDIKQPRERMRDSSKADFVTGAPGTLQPAVQFDVAGNPKVRERDHEKDRQLKIAKASADDDEHYVLGIVLEPDVVDAQKDIYAADEVRDAAHKYMVEFQNRGLMHKEIVNGKVDLLESYLAPANFTIGDQHVKKGTWVMAVRVKDAKLWNECKTGGLTGFSIGGSANRKPDPKADRKYASRKADAEKKIAFQGIPILADRPKGTIQTGTDATGKEWSREYKTDYGYISATKGGDGEGLDVFVGPNGNSPFAYWATQFNKDGDFDEYKLFLGYDSQEEAKKAYTDHIPAKYLHGMREGTVHQIKALLNQEPKESLAKAVRDMLDAG